MNKVEKCSISQKGRIVIHSGDKEKRIYVEELEYYLSLGWVKGVSEKHKKSNSIAKKGKSVSSLKNKQITQDQKEKISSTLKSKYENNEIVVWNKGLSKESDERVANNINKKNKTMMERYGCMSVNKGKHFSNEHKNKIGKANKGKPKTKLSEEKLLIKTTKQYLTRKKNNSFNKSSNEEKLYEQLIAECTNKTIYRQYRDDRYPFYCDFYILEDDLFIELNAHWTHGGRPYDQNDIECQKQLEDWQEKAKTSQFYKNAIETWTVRDVKKQKIAKENNLNYKVIY